jgi:hypothetical protein
MNVVLICLDTFRADCVAAAGRNDFIKTPNIDRLRGSSAVWEVDLLSGEVVWSYEGNEKEPFFASALSNAQRLPNGNTFVCSGSKPDHGRLFEVTPDGEIVWEFQNPYAEYAEGEKIVYRAYKYPLEMIEPLLK